jgi:hypothetical protein
MNEPLQKVALHLGRIVIGLVLLYAVLVLTGFAQKRFLTEPMGYGADTPAVYGWNGVEYVDNNYKERIGAPFEVQGLPALDRVRCLLFAPDCTAMWIVGKISGSIITGVNVYFFLTYALCFIFGLYALRFFGLSWSMAMAMALLYALLPYHQIQGLNHLYESTYFVVPIYVVILYLIYRGAQRQAFDGTGYIVYGDRYLDRGWFLIAALLFVFFPASLQPYHQFFFALFAGFAGILGSVDARKWRPFWIGLLFAGVACAGLLVQTGLDEASWGDPQHWVHTATQLTRYGEDEWYPLKLIQMLLFIPGHRVELFAQLRSIYDAGHPLINNETTSTSLGLIAAVGFLGLMWLFLTASRVQKPLPRFIARLALFGLLLGIMGGLGTVISELSWAIFGPSFSLSQARSWNRIIIFLGFFALLAFGWAMDRLIAIPAKRAGWKGSWTTAITGVAALGVFALGAWDQVTHVPPDIYAGDDAVYDSDHAFFARIDSLYPEVYRVFQWPAMVPWSGAYGKVYYTDAYRPILNSRKMHLSFGADPTSKQGRWLSQVAKLPPSQLYGQLCSLGFQGVVVHDDALVPAQRSFVDFLSNKSMPLQSGKGITYFDIRRACGTRPVVAAQCLSQLRSRLLDEDRPRRAWIGAAQFAGDTGTFVEGACGQAERRSVPGQAGWLTIGPYVALRPGDYTAHFELGGDTRPAKLQIDWQDGRDAHLLATSDPTESKSVFDLPFRVTSPQQLVEFKVQVDGSQPTVFRGVTIEQR